MGRAGARRKEDRAGKTGFEPATSGVTDQHSNQLSYFPLSLLLSIPKSPTGYLCHYTKGDVQQNAVRLWYSFSLRGTTKETALLATTQTGLRALSAIDVSWRYARLQLTKANNIAREPAENFRLFAHWTK